MRIYYTSVDYGDGSLGVMFYDTPVAIQLMEEYDLERFRGDGGGYFDCDNFSGELLTLFDAIKWIIDYGFATKEETDAFITRANAGNS